MSSWHNPTGRGYAKVRTMLIALAILLAVVILITLVR